MDKPTTKELQAFWDSQDKEATYICSTCGKSGGYWEVSPQHPYYGEGPQCRDCRKAARKADLAAMGRCECCNRRGTWWIGGVLLCGYHLARVKRQHNRNAAGAGFMGMFMASNYTSEGIRDMAQQG